MTQAEKAMAYDEAIKRAKEINNEQKAQPFDVMLKVFPELKESEDESIRKDILAFIRHEGQHIDKYEWHKWIAWIEKQGEQKPTYKPKFKVEKGEWYICIKDLLDNYANKAFRKGDTYLSTQDGSLMPSNSNVPFEVVCPDTYFRDWTIQDATDGDVLYSLDSNQPFIYKERKQNEQATAYCGLNIYGKFFVWGTKDCVITLSKYVPATKEQRDTLLKAMVDAGYKWDSENKILLSLKAEPNGEQKPAWSEEDERHKNTIIRAIHGAGNITPIDGELAEKWLKSLRLQKRWKPSEEQLDALREALSHIPDEYDTPILTEIYEQLKQL